MRVWLAMGALVAVLVGAGVASFGVPRGPGTTPPAVARFVAPATTTTATPVDGEPRDCPAAAAFPDDEAFGDLVCVALDAGLDALAAGGEVDPTYFDRHEEAVIAYAEDRDAAVAALRALLEELSPAD